MEYLQYEMNKMQKALEGASFKPYYKWNTFNTHCSPVMPTMITLVLNLIINGIPSIRYKVS